MKKENVYGSLGILPKEEMIEAKQNFQKLTIGLPKETSFQENRISLSPDSVSLLTHNGHKLLLKIMQEKVLIFLIKNILMQERKLFSRKKKYMSRM